MKLMNKKSISLILILVMITFLACSLDSKTDINGTEKIDGYSKKENGFAINKGTLFLEVEALVSLEDFQRIKCLWNDLEVDLGLTIEFDEVKHLEPIINILMTYQLHLFDDNYIVNNYDVSWAESILAASDYEQLIMMVKELEGLDAEVSTKDSEKLLSDINDLLLNYKTQINEAIPEGVVPLKYDSFYETYAVYDVEYDTFIYNDNPNLYVREVVNPRSEIDHFVSMYWWDHIRQLFPREYLKFLVGYELTSDGRGNKYALMWQDSADYRKWRLAIDPADVMEDGIYNLFKMDETLIHEFAHILTLNHEQMKSRMSMKSKTYTTDEGTLKEEAYLNHFYQMFWADLSEEYRVETDFIDAYDDRLLLKDYPESFVTDYAATHPAEDIAECFIYFVTLDKPEGNLIKDKKIRFFYAYPELVEMRDRMRKHIDWQE